MSKPPANPVSRQQCRTLAGRLVASLRESGSSNLSPTRIAGMFVAGVHLNTLRAHPESPKVQECLSNLVCVMTASVAIQPDIERAALFVKTTPIPSFSNKTAYQLIADGRT